MPKSEPILKKETVEKAVETGEQVSESPEKPAEIEGLPSMPISEVSAKLTSADQRTTDQVLELIENGDFSKADLLAEQHVKKPIASKVKSEVPVNIHNSFE